MAQVHQRFIKVLTKQSDQNMLYINYISVDTLAARYKYTPKKPNAVIPWGRSTLNPAESAIYGDYIMFISDSQNTQTSKKRAKYWWGVGNNVIVAKMAGLDFNDIELTDPFFGIIANKVGHGILGRINEPIARAPDDNGPVEVAEDDQR